MIVVINLNKFVPYCNNRYILNVFTGENFLVNNQREAAEMAGVDSKTVWYHLSKEGDVPVNGFVFRRYDSEEIEWPKYSKLQLEKFRESVV